MKWIPMSERLPENGHYYLWCSDMGSVQSDYYWDGFEKEQKYGYNIVAWMPLPRPYTADRKTEPSVSEKSTGSEKPNNSDTISRQAAIAAICNACGKIDCDKMDKCEKLQLPPANCSEFPNNCEDWQDWKDRMWAEAVVTEPQTIAEDINRRVEMGKKEWNARHIEYEPQTETRTETQTETQNSNLTFEKRTMRDCYNCKRYENDCECRECKYEPKDEPTISKMEQVAKDINVRSKTENSSEKPNNCEVKNYCDDCLYTDTCDSKEFFYACTSKATRIAKDEPQTCSVNGRPYSECSSCEHFRCTADEPQTDDDAYFLKLMGAVERGEISDAGANQAWYEYINHELQTERSGDE